MRLLRRLPLAVVLAGSALLACGAAPTSEEEQGGALASAAPPSPAPLLINEVLARESGGNPDGEFVEIVNTTGADIDLEGYSLWDGLSARHKFQGLKIGAGRALVVFAKAVAIPAGLTNAIASSSGKLDLGNQGDTVTLKDAAGAVLDTVTYGGALCRTQGVSFNRSKDGKPSAGAWVTHTSLGGRPASPGKRVDGSDFGPPPTPPGPPSPGDSGPLRIVAGNVSTGKQTYDGGEGIRIFRALRPDVALVQEMNYGKNDDPSIRAFVDAAFGAEYAYARQTGVGIPNGVVSRYPIRESGVWDDVLADTRDFVWARIDIPGPRDLWAVSVHLLTSNTASRESEATALVGQLKSKVPAGDYVVIGGDFNGGSTALLGILGQLVDSAAPMPDDQNGNVHTNAARNRHIDWVLASAGLGAFQVPTRVGAVERPHGLVFDTRLFGDGAPPAVSGDSAAAEMQHMAVVKDYLIR